MNTPTKSKKPAKLIKLMPVTVWLYPHAMAQMRKRTGIAIVSRRNDPGKCVRATLILNVSKKARKP